MSDRSFSAFIEPCTDFFDFYLQTEAGTIKRISLPMTHYNTACFLEAHNEGRHASYFDCHTRQNLKANPGQTYSEALIEVLDRFHDEPGFMERLYDSLEDPETQNADHKDFCAIQDAREAAWRRVNDDQRNPLPPIFD